MANFKNALTSGVTTQTTVYTVPANTETVVIGIMICNTTTSQITYSLDIEGTFIAKDLPIPNGYSHSPLDGKIVMQAGQTMNVSASGAVDVIVSILEK